MRLRSKKVNGIHVLVHWPPVLDLFNICNPVSAGLAVVDWARRSVLVIFWLSMSSSLTTLSMILRVVSSTTRTFHYGGVRTGLCDGNTAGKGVVRLRASYSLSCLELLKELSARSQFIGRGQACNVLSLWTSMMETPMAGGQQDG